MCLKIWCFSTKEAEGLKEESLGRFFTDCGIHEVKLIAPYDLVFPNKKSFFLV